MLKGDPPRDFGVTHRHRRLARDIIPWLFIAAGVAVYLAR